VLREYQLAVKVLPRSRFQQSLRTLQCPPCPKESADDPHGISFTADFKMLSEPRRGRGSSDQHHVNIKRSREKTRSSGALNTSPVDRGRVARTADEALQMPTCANPCARKQVRSPVRQPRRASPPRLFNQHVGPPDSIRVRATSRCRTGRDTATGGRLQIVVRPKPLSTEPMLYKLNSRAIASARPYPDRPPNQSHAPACCSCDRRGAVLRPRRLTTITAK